MTLPKMLRRGTDPKVLLSVERRRLSPITTYSSVAQCPSSIHPRLTAVDERLVDIDTVDLKPTRN